MREAYPSPIRLGKKEVADILSKPFYVQEKVDGSQCSFGRDADGTVFAASKNKEFTLERILGHPFNYLLDFIVNKVDLLPLNTTFRAELVARPRHNVLTYNRTPKGFLVLFDVQEAGKFAHPIEVEAWANRLGIDFAPVLGYAAEDGIESYLKGDSFLGGRKEGVVIKAIDSSPDRQCAKLVSEEFKEVKTFAIKGHKTPDEVIESIASALKTEARWHKAIQRLRDQGSLKNTEADIGLLIKSISEDIKKEETDTIKEALCKAFFPRIMNRAVNGLADFYMDLLNQDKT
jgi:hypothetical protein